MRLCFGLFSIFVFYSRLKQTGSHHFLIWLLMLLLYAKLRETQKSNYALTTKRNAEPNHKIVFLSSTFWWLFSDLKLVFLFFFNFYLMKTFPEKYKLLQKIKNGKRNKWFLQNWIFFLCNVKSNMAAHLLNTGVANVAGFALLLVACERAILTCLWKKNTVYEKNNMRSIMCAEAAWLATVQSTHHHEVNAMLKLSQLRSETILPYFPIHSWDSVCDTPECTHTWMVAHKSVCRMRTEKQDSCRAERRNEDSVCMAEWLPSCMMAGWLAGVSVCVSDDGDGVDRTISTHTHYTRTLYVHRCEFGQSLTRNRLLAGCFVRTKRTRCLSGWDGLSIERASECDIKRTQTLIVNV